MTPLSESPEQDPSDAGERVASPPATPAAPATPGVEDLVGQRFAERYQVELLLGSGLVGQVYRARRLEDDALLALKVMHERYRSDPNVVRRFGREAQAACGLDHPNVARTYEHGVDKGRPFICTELVEGVALNRAFQVRPLTLRRVLTPICEALSALSEAHRQGVIHRCLKPSNVLVHELPDGSMRTKLTDFGMGRLLKAVPGTARTKYGAICGAPAYMAPEQAANVEIDGRADVYAMGVLLFELLTGQVPFQGPRSEDILSKHANEAVPSPRSLRPDRTIPREVESICLRALAKDPSARYQSPREMGSAVRATLELFGARADLPIEEPERASDPAAHTVSKDRLTMPGEQLRSRHKLGVGAALLLLVCAFVWLSAPREAHKSQAELSATLAGAATTRQGPAREAVLAEARQLLARNEPVAAAALLQEAATSVGASPELDRWLGEALYRSGEKERGGALLRAYLKQRPSAPDQAAVEALLAELNP